MTPCRTAVAGVPFARACAARGLGMRGQALVEMSIVVLLLFTLVMGVMEMGRAWMILSAVTNAARHGARAAALQPSSARDPVTRLLTSGAQSSIVSAVSTQIVNATGLTLTPTVNPQADQSGVPMVAVTVTGTVPYLFQIPPFDTPMSINKTVTFRDEGR